MPDQPNGSDDDPFDLGQKVDVVLLDPFASCRRLELWTLQNRVKRAVLTWST